ncbi:MAG TPA: hypothetical protein VGQ99_15275 [Tepidisphaeraceae bacterium]|jgi:hypothetical protein|nr:hypothetical protein [Tepidisphaeraceae bacterium]
MTDGGQRPSNLDLYCDGLLAGDELRAFEEQLARDPQLRAQVDAQRKIDASLRRVLVAPAAPVVSKIASSAPSGGADTPGGSGTPARHPFIHRIRRSPWIAIAAVLIIGLSVWRVWDTYYAHHTEDPIYIASAPRTMDTIYKVEKDRGFVPMWVCRNDKEFATTFWKNLGSALTFRNAPPNVASLGLSYGNTVGLSPKCVYMLFKINGREVIVFIDRKQNDGTPKLSTPGMNLFRREAGEFVLYEMTPLDRPMVYDKFEPFDMPREWMQ